MSAEAICGAKKTDSDRAAHTMIRLVCVIGYGIKACITGGIFVFGTSIVTFRFSAKNIAWVMCVIPRCGLFPESFTRTNGVVCPVPRSILSSIPVNTIKCPPYFFVQPLFVYP